MLLCYSSTGLQANCNGTWAARHHQKWDITATCLPTSWLPGKTAELEVASGAHQYSRPFLDGNIATLWKGVFLKNPRIYQGFLRWHWNAKNQDPQGSCETLNEWTDRQKEPNSFLKHPKLTARVACWPGFQRAVGGTAHDLQRICCSWRNIWGLLSGPVLAPTETLSMRESNSRGSLTSTEEKEGEGTGAGFSLIHGFTCWFFRHLVVMNSYGVQYLVNQVAGFLLFVGFKWVLKMGFKWGLACVTESLTGQA